MIIPADFKPGTWGWFTLVCYVPDPPQAQLDRLRQLIPGTMKAPLHITVLPPRPLLLPVDEACKRVASIVERVSPFEVKLAEVAHFPETNFLYVDIAAGSEVLYQLHGELNFGELGHEELFEFRPHLTLGGPVARTDVWHAQRQLQSEWSAAECVRSFSIGEFVCLWIPPDRDENWEWNRFRSCALRVPMRAANQT